MVCGMRMVLKMEVAVRNEEDGVGNVKYFVGSENNGVENEKDGVGNKVCCGK